MCLILTEWWSHSHTILIWLSHVPFQPPATHTYFFHNPVFLFFLKLLSLGYQIISLLCISKPHELVTDSLLFHHSPPTSITFKLQTNPDYKSYFSRTSCTFIEETLLVTYGKLVTASFVIPLFPSFIQRFQTATSAVSGDYRTPADNC